MAKNENKQASTQPYTFPVHGIVIEASSIQEAEAKLAAQLAENKTT